MASQEHIPERPTAPSYHDNAQSAYRTHLPKAGERSLRVGKARRLYRQRREREATMGYDLFGEPAWDILLTLFVAHHTNQEMTASRVCISAATSTSTALRHLNMLEDRGLVSSTRDANDGRKRYVTLTAVALANVENFLDSI